MQEFEFELNEDLADMIEDLENRILEEVQKRYGTNKTGDDIANFRVALVVKVKVK